jgi:hypothetical protein
MHAVVALLEDVPSEGLVRGNVGAIVMDLAPNVYEVEFVNRDGRTYAMAALKEEQLLLLHLQRMRHQPA